jgi:hypothetical protein
MGRPRARWQPAVSETAVLVEYTAHPAAGKRAGAAGGRPTAVAGTS